MILLIQHSLFTLGHGYSALLLCRSHLGSPDICLSWLTPLPQCPPDAVSQPLRLPPPTPTTSSQRLAVCWISIEQHLWLRSSLVNLLDKCWAHEEDFHLSFWAGSSICLGAGWCLKPSLIFTGASYKCMYLLMAREGLAGNQAGRLMPWIFWAIPDLTNAEQMCLWVFMWISSLGSLQGSKTLIGLWLLPKTKGFLQTLYSSSPIWHFFPIIGGVINVLVFTGMYWLCCDH